MDDIDARVRIRDRRGAGLMWFAGISAIAGFLIFSPLVSLTVTLLAWGSQRRNGPLAEAAGVVAINWQFTYLAFQLMLVPLHLALVSVQNTLGEPWPLLTISAMLLLGTLNLVISVVMGLRVRRARSTRLFLAIPFLQKPPERR